MQETLFHKDRPAYARVPSVALCSYQYSRGETGDTHKDISITDVCATEDYLNNIGVGIVTLCFSILSDKAKCSRDLSLNL